MSEPPQRHVSRQHQLHNNRKAMWNHTNTDNIDESGTVKTLYSSVSPEDDPVGSKHVVQTLRVILTF
jgi:hypothetical protein